MIARVEAHCEPWCFIEIDEMQRFYSHFRWHNVASLNAAGGGQAFAAQLVDLVDLQRRQVADHA